MMKKFPKKLVALVTVMVLLTGGITTVNAETLATIYGTMGYYLRNPATNEVTAYTQMSAIDKEKGTAYSYIRTTLEVQKNSTGERLYKGYKKSEFKYNAVVFSFIDAINLGTSKKAAFSCHEVVGKKAYAKYNSSVF